MTMQPLTTTTAPQPREGAAPATRAEVLAHAERLARAAELLRAHARRCTEVEAPAHGEALRMARGMVRRLVEG